MILRLAAGFCVATVLTQMLVLSVLAARGNLDGDKVVKIVALVNGIDITGDRLEKILNDAKTSETPSFTEIMEQRSEQGLDMDLKKRTIDNYMDQLETMRSDLETQIVRFDQRREAFNARLDELEQGNRDEGLRELQRTLEVLPPDMAKQLLTKRMDDGEIDTVVKIIKLMALDKRKKILSEFGQSEADLDKLSEISSRIGDGEPLKSMIEDARNGK